MATELGVESVDLSDEGVTIHWTDGHTCFYTGKYLRVNCACAECVEEWTQRRILDPATVDANIRAEDYLQIGRYALQFLWSDAHYTGYTLLRFCARCARAARVAISANLKAE